jgi:hypothetical protein
MTESSTEPDLASIVGEYYADPLGFVKFAYPWGEEGTPLRDAEGPDEWQATYLEQVGAAVRERAFDGRTPVKPIRFARASGHGIGKSALSAWLINWIMSTRPGSIGTVTANTFPQLRAKTWARLKEWTALCITADWFEITDTAMRAKDPEEPGTWFCEPTTCREENHEAFAGQHAPTATSFYIFDEASAVPDKIYEVADGGMTDGEPMIFIFGNPTRRAGRFYRAIFGGEQHLWNYASIDSRTSRLTNKALIQEWEELWGEDSDFFRVRVLGLPPTADESQFIPHDLVEGAQRRDVEVLRDEPLVCGFDVSGGGSSWNVFRFRCGLDAKSIPPVKVSGQRGRDRSLLVSTAAEILNSTYEVGGIRRKVSGMFVDSAFGAAVVERLHSLGHHQVEEINFGGPSSDEHQENQRAYMYFRMKDFLRRGAIDKDKDLAHQLCVPGYGGAGAEGEHPEAWGGVSGPSRRPGTDIRPAGGAGF